MKIKKQFSYCHGTIDGVKTLTKGLKEIGINVPKKIIGYVTCHAMWNNALINTYSFCSHKDEWDVNIGRKIASERLYEIIKKLNNDIITNEQFNYSICPFCKKSIGLHTSETVNRRGRLICPS